MEVQVDGLKVASAGTRIDQLSGQIRNALAQRAAGRIESPMDLHQLRVNTRPSSVAAMAQIPVSVDGHRFPLGSLAKVQDVLEPAKVTHLGTPGVRKCSDSERT